MVGLTTINRWCYSILIWTKYGIGQFFFLISFSVLKEFIEDQKERRNEKVALLCCPR